MTRKPTNHTHIILIAALLVAALFLPALTTAPSLAQTALDTTPTPVSSNGLPQSPAATTTEQQINSVYLPPHDRVEAAERLLGVTVSAPPASPERDWQIGDMQAFHVSDVDANTLFEVDAALRYKGDVLYIWVQADYAVHEEALRRSATTFEQHTYPLVREAVGTERSPGIDGDPRIHILLTTGMGYSVAAYFDTQSVYPAEAVPGSNEHEMFFVNLDTMADAIGTPNFDGVLAHEFQHMIHWNLDLDEETWLNEGFSELAAMLTGFDNAGFASYFLSNPNTQLNTWPENQSRLPHYGAAYLFVTYFYERFGPEAVRQLAAQPANGLNAVGATLRQINASDPLTGQPVTVEDFFADWLVANLLRDASAGDGRYAYSRIAQTLPAAASDTIDVYPYSTTVSLPPYSADYWRLTSFAPRRVQVEFSGTPETRLVPVDAASGSYMWYSNRGDNMDATLTRAFDLTGVESATLAYRLWYHIEHLWDYGYVMVSTDEGATWTILETAHTTTENPHNSAYGPGYTGSSGSNLLGPVGWIDEAVDLTPFAGQRVWVRFEMLTDLATNQPGMVIDDVSIPELGYVEDFETGPGGWDSAGWLYIDNRLSQPWLLQQVTRRADGTVEITRLLDAGEATSGSWTLDVGGDAGDVFLVISPLAPITTETAQYALRLTAVE